MYNNEILPNEEQYSRFIKVKEDLDICLNILFNYYENIN